jgi:reductive dehalogenase
MTTNAAEIKASPTSSALDPGAILKGFKYRDQSGRYPWWVKSADKITVETDASIMEKPTTHIIMMKLMEKMQGDVEMPGQRPNLIKKIKSGAPGFSLPDASLQFASQTYFQSGIDIDGNMIMGFAGLREIISGQVHTPEELGVDRWEGSEEQASAMVERAAIHLGAAQVGFTAFDTTWLGPHVEISPDVKEPEGNMMAGIQIPESHKTVIVVAGRVPMSAARCAPGLLGGAADRTGYEEAQIAEEKLMNFIRGIGYSAVDIHMLGINPIPFAIMAGMGEMGRMNRVVSPYFGGAVRFFIILTDLPLALDKPIDFGLQEFCRHCKKCAKACPVNAISFETDPSWQPLGSYSSKGKKVWFEDCEKCLAYTSSAGTYCSACLGSCVWNKPNKSYFHSTVKTVAATAPSLSRFLTYMDDVFGYGLVPEERRKEWWDLDLPVKGVGE